MTTQRVRDKLVAMATTVA